MESEVSNAMNNLVSADAVTAIGTSLQANISSIVPALLGVMAVTIVAGVVLSFIKKFAKR